MKNFIVRYGEHPDSIGRTVEATSALAAAIRFADETEYWHINSAEFLCEVNHHTTIVLQHGFGCEQTLTVTECKRRKVQP